jgi:hypothetical protein
MQVVPDGFGVAYITGFDGMCCVYYLCVAGRLTVGGKNKTTCSLRLRLGRKCRTMSLRRRSRVPPGTSTPCTSWEKCPSQDCDFVSLSIIVRQKGIIPTVTWALLSGRTKTRDNFLFLLFGLKTKCIDAHRVYLGSYNRKDLSGGHTARCLTLGGAIYAATRHSLSHCILHQMRAPSGRLKSELRR